MTRNLVQLMMLVTFGLAACQDETRETSPIDAAISQCDALAAHPSDPQKPGDVAGVPDEAINARLALEACNTASRARPDLTRLKFQMGRAALAGGNPDVARGWMFAAAREGHPLARGYLQQIEAARPTAIRPVQSATNQNPHADFERQIGGVLAGAAALIALDQAIVASSPERPWINVPSGTTPAQCQAAVSERTLFCREVSTFAGDNLVYEIQCNSRWNQENRRCESGTGGQQSLPGTPSFYCVPLETGIVKGPTLQAAVSEACGG